MSPAAASEAPPVTSVATTSVVQVPPCRRAAISSPERAIGHHHDGLVAEEGELRRRWAILDRTPRGSATEVICQRSPARSATRTSGRVPATV